MGVDGPGKQLLAGSAFALDQDRGVGRRHLADLVENFKDTRIFADDVVEIVALENLTAQDQVFLLQTLVFNGLFYRQTDLFIVEGLGQVVECAQFHRLHGIGHR